MDLEERDLNRGFLGGREGREGRFYWLDSLGLRILGYFFYCL